ncbi:hypothetical protein [Mycobacterium sp.]|uniref:hypothetical protein n=1 Tax=Mycobacterium sp. TaxID=1785 RepID=UPI00120AE352|nr:hypothetical protein [Mycobacterium sp.]TAM69154.1 MAG: hypothetical protein EPN51_09735 [Mycobacterium sp.]
MDEAGFIAAIRAVGMAGADHDLLADGKWVCDQFLDGDWNHNQIAAKAPKLANPMELLTRKGAMIQTEPGYAIVGPSGICFAQADTAAALLCWLIDWAARSW